MSSLVGIIGEGQGATLGSMTAEPYIAVTLDATVNEVFTASASVTENPVEDGSNVCDHVREEPDELQIEGIISNTPIMPMASLYNVPTRAEDAYSALLDLMSARAAITVSTPKGDYEDMVMTSLSRTRNAAAGDAAHVSIKLRKIRKVASTEVGAPKRPATVQKKRKPLGKQPTAPAKNQSFLSALRGR
jgi:hypothetical protein